ncbi:MAG: hypothetical protein IKD05_02640 [Tidjanibacter sp.]|nr:hypothetical protein [Tidjanibacter sp.]MBR3681874.1 hypothetical protein [Tidjanibacter sp.]MBR7129155.1 hypothetical protein [Tidjanibacter sp.]
MKNRFVVALLAVVLGASSCGPKANVEIYDFPAEYEASEMWSVRCGAEDVFVMPTEEPHLASLGCDGRVKLTVEYLAGDVERVDVRPQAKEYDYKVKGNRITIYLEPYQKAVIEVNGDLVNPLFIFANPLECARPQKDDPNVIYCEAGKVHHADSLVLHSNQHLYLEGGAVLKGYLLASHADNVKISGPGYVDARHKGLDQRALLFEYCNGVHLEDFMIINKNWWTCVLCVCNDVQMTNYKTVAPPSDNASGHENDGIDILGGQNITLNHCFCYCHDDAFVVKSRKWDWGAAVKNVEFNECIGWNVNAGNTFEIGWCCGEDITDIRYNNIYAVHSGSRGRWYNAALAIHNASRGVVSGIVYNNVYIEDPQRYLFHVSITESHFNIGTGVKWAPGKISDVTYNNIHVYKAAPEKDGSQFYGWNDEFDIQNVLFKNVYIEGKKVTSLEDLNVTKMQHAKNFRFE